MFLVIGATGKQGGAVIEHLKGQPTRALVRNTNSGSARKLQQQGVELASGNLTSSDDIYAALEGCTGAFLVTVMLEKGAEDEIVQGKAFIDAAKRRNLKHVVMSSVNCADAKTGIPHFESKWEVEQLLRSSGLSWTVIRPVAFMDNFPRNIDGLKDRLARFFTIGLFGAALSGGKRIQLVSCHDIGYVAAQALKKPGQYIGQTVDLAADNLTASEIQDAYYNAQGSRPYKALLPRLILWLMPYDFRAMFQWFGTRGYTANINALRSDYPDLLTFEKWLKK